MDLDLWTRWARMGARFESVEDYIWAFQVHLGSTTSRRENRHAMALEYQRILRRYGIAHETMWRNFSRIAVLFDGTRWRRIRDSYHLRNKCVFDCGGR